MSTRKPIPASKALFILLLIIYPSTFLILRATLTQHIICNDYIFGITHSTAVTLSTGHTTSCHTQLRIAAYLTAAYYPLILLDERITGADFTTPSEIFIHL